MNENGLPLFPLPMVLFPGTVAPLHIFEPRYRQMVADVLEGDGRFGILYHDPDERGPFLSEAGRVGTLARIRRHQPLPDGRSIIMVRGDERFSIRQGLEAGTPYYQALVDPFPDTEAGDPDYLVARRKRSLTLFKSILRTLPHVPDALPSFSVKREISFPLAGLVRMDTFWQQELLELRSELARLDRLDPVFQAGIERLWEERGTEA